jgi:DNA-binding beta-propeller fold protein YncE
MINREMMNRDLHTSKKRPIAGLLIVLALFAGLVAAVVSAGDLAGRERNRQTRNLGEDRLVSFQKTVEMEGPMCELVPASAGQEMIAALQQSARSGAGAQEETTERPSDAMREAAAKRQPVRVMKDRYAAYSTVAVDPIRNEVVMADENLFSVLAYNRTENTPRSATMSEPKRIISGLKAEIEFSCGLYIDPANGDVYVVNNDTLNTLAIFSHDQKGDVAPVRTIDPPHTTFGIAVHEPSKELYLTIQDDAAVVVYNKYATKKEVPLRTLQGPKTRLADPHGIALDDKRDLLFVSNWGTVNEHRDPKDGKPRVGTLGKGTGVETWPIGRDYGVIGSGEIRPPSIAIFHRTDTGDTAPLRIIEGPKTQMNWPTALAVDPEKGELFVANDTSHSVLVFRVDQEGDVAPVRVIKGPKTLLHNPTGLTVDLKNRELWVASFGNHTATVFPLDANGDVAPKRVIRSAPLDTPAPMLGNPHTIRFDSNRKEVLVAN